ncbi:ParB/RepB/Spo0J family partition protein [Patescibacteria group bacterium]
MALGKGLGSLIPPKQPIAKAKEKIPAPSGQGINLIETNKIVPNPMQPRDYFADSGMEDLISSIKEHGILQPLIVSPLPDGKYELVAGERRFRAAKFNKIKEVPALVRKVKEHEKLEFALIENLQRENLNPIEEAKGFRQLMEEFKFSQGEVSKKVGKSRPVVANTLRLLNLSDEIQKALARKRISASAGRVLAGIADKAKQKELFRKMLQGLTVRESEVKSRLGKPTAHTKRAVKDPILLNLEEKLRESLKTKVDIKKSGKTYKLMVECYSEEELKKITKLLS